VVVAGAVTLTGTAGPALADRGHDRDQGNAFRQVNLVSDNEGLAAVQDGKLINPWGVAFGPVANPTPLWTSNQGSNSSHLYTGTTKDNAAKVGLEVAASSPTGIVFNPTTDFVVRNGKTTGPARFIFDEVTFNQQGVPTSSHITGWVNTNTPIPQTTVTKATKENAFYSGLALVPAQGKSGPLLLAANFVPGGSIDIYDGKFHKVTPTQRHNFVDPYVDLMKTPPYNVAYLGGRVYVAYAAMDPHNQSVISVFTADGRFRKHLVTGSPLVGPWGMAIAPKGWGDFGGDLLVGNVDDGTINAFDKDNGHFRGTIRGADGKPLVNAGLWGIQFGNGLIGTPNSLVFAAGIGETPTDFDHFYQHGLVGLIEPVHNKDDND
jgi:uncharacterized protein (TIGR03118 family)